MLLSLRQRLADGGKSVLVTDTEQTQHTRRTAAGPQTQSAVKRVRLCGGATAEGRSRAGCCADITFSSFGPPLWDRKLGGCLANTEPRLVDKAERRSCFLSCRDACRRENTQLKPVSQQPCCNYFTATRGRLVWPEFQRSLRNKVTRRRESFTNPELLQKKGREEESTERCLERGNFESEPSNGHI